MADQKITTLGAVTTLADTDLLTVVTSVATIPVNKKITVANSRAQLKGTTVIGTTRYNQFYLAAGRDLKPTITEGCAASAQIEMGTNKNVYDYLAFDPSSTEKAYANVVMPEDYTGGNLYAKFYWTHPATTIKFGVRWAIYPMSISPGETLDVAISGVGGVTSTGGNTSYLYISDMTPSITPVGTPSAGDLMGFRVIRSVGNAEDIMDVDAYLLGVMIWYPVA